MRASELFSNVEGRLLKGTLDFEVSHITDDSRKCTKGSIFFAIKGETTDGHLFVGEAVRKGARLVVVERPVDVDASVFLVKDTKKVAEEVLRRFYRGADREIFKIGITGTNGKSTVAYLLWQFLERCGKRCALVGTIEYVVAGKRRRALNTTPGLFEFWEVMGEACQGKDEFLVMEVSSHSLKQNRLGDVSFEVAVFTNLSRDHLDYHGDMQEYFECKKKLFVYHLKGTAVVNVDDEYGRVLAKEGGQVLSYGIYGDCKIRGRFVQGLLDGSVYEIDGKRVYTTLIGEHNLYNVLAAYTVALDMGLGEDFLAILPELKAPPGRLERFSSNGLTVFVDYAHTPDALERVLRELKRVSEGKLIVVFGCGGDRDRGKRPLMGRVASEIADYVVITSDNPRSESPEAIVADIMEGIAGKNYTVVLDRAEAIEKAVSIAKKGDVILVAGKGHEDYQIIGNRRIHFDDREVVRKVLGIS